MVAPADRPYAAIVTSARDLDALAWIDGPGEIEQVDGIAAERSSRQPGPPALFSRRGDDGRESLSRNIALFGEEGQRKIAATAVAVVARRAGVSCGATARIPRVIRYALIDDDAITGRASTG